MSNNKMKFGSGKSGVGIKKGTRVATDSRARKSTYW